MFTSLVPLSQSACLVPVTPSRWRGDYGGKKQLWFPANYVEEIMNTLVQEQDEAVSLAPMLAPFPTFQHNLRDPLGCPGHQGVNFVGVSK